MTYFEMEFTNHYRKRTYSALSYREGTHWRRIVTKLCNANLLIRIELLCVYKA